MNDTSTDSPIHPVIIIGAGQAGLATAYYLQRAGIRPLLFDDQPSPGGAWLHVWPSMTLFSTSDFSNLPGKPMPKFEGFPPAEHVVKYLADYEKRYDFDVRRPVKVTSVEAIETDETDSGIVFTVHAESSEGAGETYRARHIVAATGTWSSPFVPAVPGRFTGRQWHSANYPGSEAFRGSSVAVVGAANSAAQLAAELALDPEVGEVTWYTRHEPRWMPDDVDGRVLFQRNSQRALAVLRGEPDPGADSALGDIVMLPAVKQARDQGLLTATPMFHTLDDVHSDHIIWCTGFRPALGPVRGLLTGRKPKYPGVHLVGYGDWVGPGSATITGVGPSAKAAALAVIEAEGRESATMAD
ncbi:MULTISPECIES: FAD-dependent oxidoreductase [unclassified Corynebacterium]|uniref:FAD-dependent oxidoreductase n=1 Tax=unclassified Corynebacterium TaxID=2624378 RepID=UPI0030A01930